MKPQNTLITNIPQNISHATIDIKSHTVLKNTT